MQDKRLWMGVGLIHGGSSLGLAVDIDVPASDGMIPKLPSTALVRSQRRLPASRLGNLEDDGRPGGDFLEIVAMRARATPHRGGTSKERCFEIGLVGRPRPRRRWFAFVVKQRRSLA